MLRFTLTLVALAVAFAPATAMAGEPTTPKKKVNTGGFSEDDFNKGRLTDARQRAIMLKIYRSNSRKIKQLEGLASAQPPPQNLASVLFRLAEATREVAQYDYLKARDDYDKKYECFEQKRCKEEPKEPVEDISKALSYYRRVLREFPQYRRIDEVMFHLGKAALRQGKLRKDTQLSKEGVKYLQDLVQLHPKSIYIDRTHLALAEHFFENDRLFNAKTNYEKIINNFKRSPMYNYALYKLGWVYYNLTEFEKTIETFKAVVKAAKKKNAVDFRNQALNDLIVTWAEIDNGWRDARTYMMKEVGEKETYKKLDRMAGLLVSKDKDLEAIALFKHLIDHDKVAAKVPEYFDAVMEVRRKIGAMTETEAEINGFTAFLDKKGQWFTANKSNQEAVDKASSLVSSNLFFLANHYHRGAQKLDDQKKKAQAQPSYLAAAKYYKMFLDRFPDHKDSYKLSFFYAEILFDQLNEYDKAAVQYEKVIAADKRGDYMEDAALGVIYALERKMCSTGVRKNCVENSKGETVQVVKQEEDTSSTIGKGGETKKIEKTPLNELEKRYVNAADTYVSLLRDALKDPKWLAKKENKNRGKMIPEIMFIAAQVFYQHGQFKDAVERLNIIFELYPEHKMAGVAARAIIQAYAQLKRWTQAESWARKLLASKTKFPKKKIEQMIAIAKNEHAKDLMKQRRYDEAIKVQLEIVDEFGRKNKEISAGALYNVGIIHEEARRFPEAVAAYEQVIKRYKKEKVAIKASFAIGLLYESQTKFDEAAKSFMNTRQFAKDKKVRDQAADAIRNAGLLYEALDKHQESFDAFQTYVKTFKEKDDIKNVEFLSAQVLERNPDEKARKNAAKAYEKLSKKLKKKDPVMSIQALAAAAMALKKADKVKNEKKVTKLLRKTLDQWAKLAGDEKNASLIGSKEGALAKEYAANCSLELAEYAYDRYAKLKIRGVNSKGKFSVKVLKDTLVAKAEALGRTQKAFDKVLAFKSPNMTAAAAFRIGQLYYEFSENLFNADVPPGLTEEQVDEYRFQLEEFAAPIQEKALVAFTAALKQALQKGVYNKWSRLSAKFAAKVNPDEFPLADTNMKPNKTKDTLQSTSFIRIIRRGNTVVDFTKKVKLEKTDTKEGK